MKTLHRNKRPMYLCQVYQSGTMKKYKEPIRLLENWQVTNTDSLFMNLGLESYDYIKIKTSVNHAKYYHLGDKAYIFVNPPTTYDDIAKDADYIVYRDPIVTFSECQVLLKKLSGRNGDKNIF